MKEVCNTCWAKSYDDDDDDDDGDDGSGGDGGSAFKNGFKKKKKFLLLGCCSGKIFTISRNVRDFLNLKKNRC